MKSGLITLMAATLAFHAVAQDKKPEQKSEAPKTQAASAAPMDEKELREKVSYAVGMHFGNQLKRSNYDFDLNEVAKAMKDVTSGGTPKMTDAEAQGMIQKWQVEQQAAQKRKGEEFLAENAKKSGVKTTASGLQYEILTPGTGKTPTSNDVVKVNYRGTLPNGTEFDSSYKRGQPAEFPVMGVIKGWTEALQMMKEGAKWKLVIPAQLAYGDRGTPNIPPGSPLVFEVELLEVKSAPKPEDSVHAVSGEIIKVPSAEELKKGAKIEVLKEEDVRKLTNSASTNKATSTDTAQPKK